MNQNILDDQLIQEDLQLVPASKGKRFANFIIDYVLIFIAMVVISIFQLDSSYSEEVTLWDRIMGIIVYLSYYVILEGALKGKTPAKYITGTRTVGIDGSTPDGKTFLLRSLSRIVPFEAFSFLGSEPHGWHDRWTDTMVIDESKSSYH